MAMRIEIILDRSRIREQQYFKKWFLSAYSSAFKIPGTRKTKRLLSEFFLDDLS